MNAVNQPQSNRSRPVDRARMERVAALIARYPALTDDEIHEALLFLRKGPALDVGLLTGNDEIRPQLDRFRADHHRALSIGVREIAVIAVIVALFLAAVLLLWDWGAGK